MEIAIHVQIPQNSTLIIFLKDLKKKVSQKKKNCFIVMQNIQIFGGGISFFFFVIYEEYKSYKGKEKNLIKTMAPAATKVFHGN